MGESEGEASTATDEQQDASQVRCTACDAAIDTSDWYPVTKERDGDGALHIHPFCSEECRDEWLAERPG